MRNGKRWSESTKTSVLRARSIRTCSSWLSREASAILCFYSDYYSSATPSTWRDLSGHTNVSLFYYASSTSTAWTPTVTPTSSSASGMYFPGNSGNGNGYYAHASTAVSIGTSFSLIIRVWPTSNSGPPFLFTLNRNSGNTVNEAAAQLGYYADASTGNGFGAGIPNGNIATFPVTSSIAVSPGVVSAGVVSTVTPSTNFMPG